MYDKRLNWVLLLLAVFLFFGISNGFSADFLLKIGNKAYYSTVDSDILIAVHQGAAINVPDYQWWYGCSPTSAGMMMGYYDINGYAGLNYGNLVPGGVADVNTFGNPGALVNYIIASPEHIRDFWTGYGNHGDDPHPAGTHHPNCLADFMGTNQDSRGNSDGDTTFYFLLSGARTTTQLIESEGLAHTSGMHGIGDYVWYAGYGSSLFNQLIYGYNGNTQGFTWQQFKNEIDAGRPVIIQLDGHSVLGYGYSGDSTVYVHDTFSGGVHTMTWGGNYVTPDGIQLLHIGVTCFTPYGGTASSESVPAPPSLPSPRPPVNTNNNFEGR